MKRLFVIHGWMGSSNELRYQELKVRLEEKEFEVTLLDMPGTKEPKIEPWVGHLEKAVGTSDKDTYFLGNSIRCQTIMRYLEKLKDSTKVGGVIFSAGWVHLNDLEDEETEEIARPWLDAPLDWEKIRSRCDKWPALFSDDDSYVPLDDKEIFASELGAKTAVEHEKGHFPGYDNGAVFNAILEMSK